MSADENRKRVARAFDAFNRGDYRNYLAAYSPRCVLHGFPPQVEPTYEGLAGVLEEYTTGLPDAQLVVHDVIAEGNQALVRFTMMGTHKGRLFGADPTGKRISFETMTVLRFDDQGRIAERWQRSDEVGLLKQLGLLDFRGRP